MKVTRVIAVAVMATSVGLTALNAQTLRQASPPAEFPPSSYTGKQYVDSRGCIYIRAGIDGNTTWVPRVSRDRKQVCGYKPTAVAGATTAPKTSTSVEQITLPASTQPTTTAKTTAPTTTTATTTTAVPKAQPKPVPAPAAVTAAKPRTVTTTKTTTARPTTTTTAPKTTTQVAPAAPAPNASTGGCSNASSFSQQFINKKGARCGPQTEAPVTYGSGWDNSSLTIDPDTRIVPRHVYENRQNTRDVVVPAGYRTVWQDDRLNPYRAERTAQAAVIQSGVQVPRGFRMVERDDDRLNPNRAYRNAQGDAQSDLIWTRTVPRTLVPFENTQPVITLAESVAKSSAEAEEPVFLSISTRSAPGAGTLGGPQPSTEYAVDHK